MLDLDITPDGKSVIVSDGATYEHRSYSLPNLTLSTVYRSGAYPVGATTDGLNLFVVVARDTGGEELRLYLKGVASALPLDREEFRGVAAPHGIVLTPSGRTLFAITKATHYDGGPPTLHIFAGPTALIRIPPVSVACTIGELVTLKVTVAPPSASIMWQVSKDGGVHWSTITGQHGPSLRVTCSVATQPGTAYRVVVSNGTRPPEVSDPVTLVLATP
jgi:hypothetical protein